MDIQICQSCGIILRGKSKFCTGCGTTVSKFSPVTLPSIPHTAAPLSLKLEPDPLVLERTMNRVQYANALIIRADSPLLRKQATPTAAGGNGNGHHLLPAAADNWPGLPEAASQAGGSTAPNPLVPAPLTQEKPQPAAGSPLQNAIGQASAQVVQPAPPAHAFQNFMASPASAQAATPEAAESAEGQPATGSQPSVALKDPTTNIALAPNEEGQPGLPLETTAASSAAAGDWSPAAPSDERRPLAEPSPPNQPALQPASQSAASQAEQAAAALFRSAPVDSPNAVSQSAPQKPATAAAVADQTNGMPQPLTPKPAQGQIAAPSAPASNEETAPQSAVKSLDTVFGSTPQAMEAPARKDPAAFDFFASTFNDDKAKKSLAAAQVNGLSASRPQASATDQIAIPEGMPAVVAQALKAANNAANNAANSAAGKAEDEGHPPIDEYPDESVNRRNGKASNGNGDGDADSRDGKQTSTQSQDGEGQAKRGYKSLLHDQEECSGKDDTKAKTITLGSWEVSHKHAIIMLVAIVLLGLPLCMFLLSAITSPLAPMLGSRTPSLNGRWEVGVLDSKGRNHRNDILITQRGSQLNGQGQEEGGRFLIDGVYQYPKVQFRKVYVDSNFQPLKDAKQVNFLGQVDWVNSNPGKTDIPFYVHMFGEWTLTKRLGYGWRAQIITLSNRWEAGLLQPMQAPADDLAQAGGHSLLPAAPQQPGGGKLPQLFGYFAAGLLLIGVILAFTSLKMFGPAGLLNIWAKKQYIPTQYRAQHYKMLREFGKPPKPGGMPLGTRPDWSPLRFWLPKRLALPPAVREKNPHMLVIGAGHKGKTRLLANMIIHDIECGDRAVAVIDSDGGLAELITNWIGAHPKGAELAKRVTLIDPLLPDNPAYNPLELPEDGDFQSATAALVGGFKAMYTEPPGSQSQWNQQTADILRNSAMLLMANGKTLIDLPTLLSENDFRDILLEKVERLKNEKTEYGALVEAWARYKRMARTDQWINWIEPILNRINPMLGDPRIRPILTKPVGDLNLQTILQNKGILLVKVPHGQHAKLLGSLIVAGLKRAAGSLWQSTHKTHRCSLYMDEFDDFIEKQTIEAIASKTNKFGLGLICCTKTLQGLPEDYRNELIINMGLLCVFALAKKDADLIAPQMFRVDGRKIKQQTLQNIFNKVNTTPQFELITDEEKLNIDRVVGMEERTFFGYRLGTVAGVFQVKAFDFKDIAEKDIDKQVLDQIHRRVARD